MAPPPTPENRASRPNSPNEAYKRPLDLVILFAAHVALAPLWLIMWLAIPLAIWLEDRGPVFYTQLRLGKGGRTFKVYKFRSMVRDAEEYTGAVWAADDDPRITKVGKLLRARALDELPQVINLWKGDLSLVGLRPERPGLAAEFAKELPRFSERLRVRPDLTGVAQVYGRYATRPRDKLRYDLLYIRKMSPQLDIKLLFMSVWLTATGHWHDSEKHFR
ncbi:MAG: sugar transferase [SAR202 cluster bacterium]|nr:sugar transferase [SAR202 cluster bacterium]